MRSAFIFAVLASLLLFTGAAPSPSVRDLLASGHVDDAMRTLDQQVQRTPSDAESYLLLCRTYFMMEDWDRGIANCERARDLEPQNSLHYLWLGRVYGEKADHANFLSAAGLAKKVRTAFERAVELNPNGWEARADLGEFYLDAPGIVGGGKDKAREQANALMPLKPGKAYWLLGQIAEKDKKLAEAERQYRVGIEVTHGTRAWVELAIFFKHTNRLDEMEKTLRELENAKVDDPLALMDGASLIVRTGKDPKLGIRLLQRYFSVGTVEEGPAFRAHEHWGQLLERQGDHRGAAQEYHAALDLYHNYRRAEEGLKRVER